jgi:hypothetical protein
LKALILIGFVVVAGFSSATAPAIEIAEDPAFDEVRLNYFKVEEQGPNFILTWESEVEESVRSFEVQRRTTFSNGQYVVVQDYRPHGIRLQYLYKDDQVFKSASDTQDVVEYRLVVVFQSGARQILASKSVNYTSTALRRTWGSIKAMF